MIFPLLNQQRDKTLVVPRFVTSPMLKNLLSSKTGSHTLVTHLLLQGCFVIL